MEEKLLEAPKKAILLGLTIGYRGLSFMEFNINIFYQQTSYSCDLQLKITERGLLSDVLNYAIHCVKRI